MTITVRDLIVNSCVEARLVPRTQAVPGPIMVSAFNLLKNRASEYSNTNLLSFLRRSMKIEPEKLIFTLGDLAPLAPYRDKVKVAQNSEDQSLLDTDYVYYLIDLNDFVKNRDGYWETSVTYSYEQVFGNSEVPDVFISGLNKITRLYDSEGNLLCYKPFEEFLGDPGSYTWIPLDDQRIQLHLSKLRPLQMFYSLKWDFTLDTELRIPDQFTSLFQSALVYDLSREFPRTSDSTVSLLGSRLSQLEQNVRASEATSKFISRYPSSRARWSNQTYLDALNGET